MSNLFVSALSRPRRWTLAALATGVMLAVAGAPAIAQTPPDPLVATVNGIEIHQSDLTLAEEELGGQLPQGNTEAKREYLIGIVTNMVLLAQAAEQKHVQDEPNFKRKLAFTRNKVLMETLLQEEVKKAMTDQALHTVYDEAVKQIPSEEEVHARHILFRVADWKDTKAAEAAEAKAKAVVERLRKGEDFVKLANELTEDPSGKKDGGDLGYFSKEEMVPQFAAAAFALEKGKFSEPVKTEFGWHVILVEDKRKRAAPPFEQVKPQLERMVARKAQVDLVTKLRAEAKIERVDKPAQPPTPPAPAVPAPAAPK